MNPDDIKPGRQYMVKVGGKRWIVLVELLSVNLIKTSNTKCPHEYRCLDLTTQTPLTVQCAARFLRYATARDIGAASCGMLTLVNDQGHWDRRKCVLPSRHRGKCLTSLYLLEGLPVDPSEERWIESLLADDESDSPTVSIPRAMWPRFEL